jgi:hypothetical protein
MAEAVAPRILISYSHDNPAHCDRVLALADRLRADGIDAMIDQHIQTPPEGWPAWCAKQIETADFVLMVCTETYLRRASRKEEPGAGHGVLWEGRLINQYLYDAGSVSAKFVPVLLADGSDAHVPLPVKGGTIYRVETPEGYLSLLRLLSEQPLTPMPPLGKRRSLPPRERRADGAAIAPPRLSVDAFATKGAEGGGRADLVEFGVSHPSAIADFSPFVVWTLAFRQEERARAQEYAAQVFGGKQTLPLGGSRKIRRGSTLEFRMSVDSCLVEPKSQTIQWHGEMTTVSFRVVPSVALRSGRLVGWCEVRTRRASLCSVHFEIPISATTPSRPTLAVGCPLRSVFASYARLDFLRVWPCVRGMKAVGVQVFMDRAILRPGQRWQEEISRQILRSEKLLLFWSRHARNSGWVEREWRYSLTQKGIDSIQPFPLADPRRVPPPAELGKTLHFDDWDLDHEPSQFALLGNH